MILRLLLLAAVLTFALPLRPAQAEIAVFSAQHGLAIGGYDTVAFFDEGRAVAGQPRHSVMWKGVIWRFASARNRQRFESNPRAYAPRFGGYCAYAMSRGHLNSGNPQLWVIWDGRLYLLNNEGVREIWLRAPDDRIATAQGFWPDVLRK
ncbi:YHS domain-containing (seleno)protein [Roseobacteraceae bacterium NS-SX3]